MAQVLRYVFAGQLGFSHVSGRDLAEPRGDKDKSFHERILQQR